MKNETHLMTFKLEANTDSEELSCWVCGYPKYNLGVGIGTGSGTPEYVMTLKRPGETAGVGIHKFCAERNGVRFPEQGGMR